MRTKINYQIVFFLILLTSTNAFSQEFVLEYMYTEKELSKQGHLEPYAGTEGLPKHLEKIYVKDDGGAVALDWGSGYDDLFTGNLIRAISNNRYNKDLVFKLLTNMLIRVTFTPENPTVISISYDWGDDTDYSKSYFIQDLYRVVDFKTLKQRQEEERAKRIAAQERERKIIQEQIPRLSIEVDSLQKDYLRRLSSLNSLKQNLLAIKNPQFIVEQMKIAVDFNNWKNEIETLYDNARLIGFEIDKKFKTLNIKTTWFDTYRKVIDDQIGSLFMVPDLDNRLLSEIDKIIKELNKIDTEDEIKSIIQIEKARIQSIAGYKVESELDKIQNQIAQLNKINNNKYIGFSNQGATFSVSDLKNKVTPYRSKLKKLNTELLRYKDNLSTLNEILFIYGFTRTNYYYLSVAETKDKRYKKIEKSVQKSPNYIAINELAVEMWNFVTKIKRGNLPPIDDLNRILTRKNIIHEYSYIIRSSFDNKFNYAPIGFDEEKFIRENFN